MKAVSASVLVLSFVHEAKISIFWNCMPSADDKLGRCTASPHGTSMSGRQSAAASVLSSHSSRHQANEPEKQE